MQNSKVVEIEKLTGEQLQIFEIAYNAARMDLGQQFISENSVEDLDDKVSQELNASARGVALNVSLLYAIHGMTFNV